ncbi:GNAT family N-acetyltransferase [Psychrobacter sp. FME13]|nr:GNAT family N-acetyltransferase [Psychrobacter sp. FME13]
MWQRYLTFYETSLPMSTTDATWRNLLDSNVAIYGFTAWRDTRLVGITHVVLHPNTWDTTECCYLEDLYVNESVRGQGVGRALIEQVYDFARQQNCNRVYWTTQEGNTTARNLYDTIATQTDMVQYRKNL